jgi:hypothetical protein
MTENEWKSLGLLTDGVKQIILFERNGIKTSVEKSLLDQIRREAQLEIISKNFDKLETNMKKALSQDTEKLVLEAQKELLDEFIEFVTKNTVKDGYEIDWDAMGEYLKEQKEKFGRAKTLGEK